MIIPEYAEDFVWNNESFLNPKKKKKLLPSTKKLFQFIKKSKTNFPELEKAPATALD